ncbi:MAG: DUF4435 domain-containing protein [Bacteroidia bacterium]|nr:DUF4435 domain-containing protein [Bacteroidia bacterium]
MEFLKYLKSAAKSNTSVRTKFLQQYNKNDKSIHIFYEGNDDPSFYTNYFEQKSKLKVYHYQAENKAGVYEIHSKINWNIYKRNRALFFADKDFSDILKEIYPTESNIFVTKHYSIENYLVCKAIFTRILRDILHIDDDKFINKCYRNFDKNLKIFSYKIQPLIAWIVYHRSIKSKLQLNNFKISDLFYFDNNLNINKHKLCNGLKIQNHLLTKTKLTHTPNCWKGILHYYKQIRKIHSHKVYVRGKYEIWFLATYINKLVTIINNSKNAGEPKIKMQFNLTADNAVELLGPRLKKPNDLSVFLETNKK